MDPAPTNFDINSIGIRLSKLKQMQLDYHARMGAVDAEMRETEGLTIEGLAVKLSVIKDLLAQNDTAPDFEKVNSDFRASLIKLTQDQLIDFQSLLDARKSYMLGGTEITLTKENKLKLMTDFAMLIDGKIQSMCFTFDSTMDLLQLEKDVASELERHMRTYEILFKNKTAINSLACCVKEELDKVSKIQAARQSHEITNIWEAAEAGDFDYIKTHHDDLYRWQKWSFFDQKNASGCTLLAIASLNGHEPCVDYLLQNLANPTIRDEWGYEPIHWAAKNGHLNIASRLLKVGAAVDAAGEYQRTPLHFAARNGHAPVVKLLIEKNAYINAQTDQNDSHQTALHEATSMGHTGVVTELAACVKLNVNLLNAKGYSALYYAVSLGFTGIAALIVSHPSWKSPTDTNDPNHIRQLLTLKPTQNAGEMKIFLERCLSR